MVDSLGNPKVQLSVLMSCVSLSMQGEGMVRKYRQEEAVPVCCRQKPQEASVTLWVLSQACLDEPGRACLGKVGKRRATPWIPRERQGIRPHLAIMQATYLSHHCLGGGTGPDL